MVDFKAWKDQPVKPLRMVWVMAAFVSHNWRVVAHTIGPSIMVTFLAFLPVRFAVKNFGMPGNAAATVMFIIMGVLSAGVAVSVQRWVLLGESPPRLFGLTLGRREGRTLVYWLWFLFAMAFGYLVSVIVVTFTVGVEKDTVLHPGIWLFLFMGWLIATLMLARPALALPRAALDLPDADIQMKPVLRFFPGLGIPESTKALMAGHLWKVRLVWFVVGCAINAFVFVVVGTGYWLNTVTGGKMALLVAMVAVWYVGVALFHILNALLYLRLGGEVEVAKPPKKG